jgi:hypothetical protein
MKGFRCVSTGREHENAHMRNDKIFLDVQNIRYRDTTKFRPLAPRFLEKGGNAIAFLALVSKIDKDQ